MCVCSCAFGSCTGILRLIWAYHGHGRTMATATGVPRLRQQTYYSCGKERMHRLTLLTFVLHISYMTRVPCSLSRSYIVVFSSLQRNAHVVQFNESTMMVPLVKMALFWSFGTFQMRCAFKICSSTIHNLICMTLLSNFTLVLCCASVIHIRYIRTSLCLYCTLHVRRITQLAYVTTNISLGANISRSTMSVLEIGLQTGIFKLLCKMATCCRGVHDILSRNSPLYYDESLKKLLRDKIVFKVGSIKLHIILCISVHYRASSPDFIKGPFSFSNPCGKIGSHACTLCIYCGYPCSNAN